MTLPTIKRRGKFYLGSNLVVFTLSCYGNSTNFLNLTKSFKYHVIPIANKMNAHTFPTDLFQWW